MIKEEFKNFINFLLEKNIFQVGVSFIIASQTRALSSKVVEALVFPFVIYLMGKDFEKRETEIGNVKIKTGVLIKALVEFILIMLFIFYLYKISQPKGLLENITDTIYGFF